MSIFNFGRKKATAAENSTDAADEEVHETGKRGKEISPSLIIRDNPSPGHDGVANEIGPFDGDEVDFRDFELEDFAMGMLDMGSLKVAVPKGSQIQVETGPDGSPRQLHIVTAVGRMTPVGFAAPISVGQWDRAALEIVEQMTKEGVSVTVERGTWGNEVVGRANDTVVRVIGADAPRWMLRMTVMSPADTAHDAANLARQTMARTFVYRGEDPLSPGTALPVTMPQELVEQMAQLQQQQQQPRRSNDATEFFRRLSANRRPPVVPGVPATDQISQEMNEEK